MGPTRVKVAKQRKELAEAGTRGAREALEIETGLNTGPTMLDG